MPDLRQAFADFIVPIDKGTTTVRLGRQELWLGPTRWMAVRDPTNLRRSFDGGLIEYRDDTYILRTFAMRPVLTLFGRVRRYDVHRRILSRRLFTGKTAAGVSATIDLYLLGREQDSVTYARGTGREDRWTAGGRVAGKWRRSTTWSKAPTSSVPSISSVT